MRWLLITSLMGFLGCAQRVTLLNTEQPQWIPQGTTFIAPWDGYFMQDGVLFMCERSCIRKAMGLEP